MRGVFRLLLDSGLRYVEMLVLGFNNPLPLSPSLDIYTYISHVRIVSR